VPDGRALPIALSLITNHIPRRYCVGRDRGTGLPLGIGYAAESHLVAVGVGVGVPLPSGAWISTVMGDPVLKKPGVALAVCGG
jgi:hypothetical protein